MFLYSIQLITRQELNLISNEFVEIVWLDDIHHPVAEVTKSMVETENSLVKITSTYVSDPLNLMLKN